MRHRLLTVWWWIAARPAVQYALGVGFFFLVLSQGPTIAQIEEADVRLAGLYRDATSSPVFRKSGVVFYRDHSRHGPTYLYYRVKRDKVRIDCMHCDVDWPRNLTDVTQVAYVRTRYSGRYVLEIKARSGTILLDRATALQSIRSASNEAQRRLATNAAPQKRSGDLSFAFLLALIGGCFTTWIIRNDGRGLIFPPPDDHSGPVPPA